MFVTIWRHLQWLLLPLVPWATLPPLSETLEWGGELAVVSGLVYSLQGLRNSHMMIRWNKIISEVSEGAHNATPLGGGGGHKVWICPSPPHGASCFLPHLAPHPSVPPQETPAQLLNLNIWEGVADTAKPRQALHSRALIWRQRCTITQQWWEVLNHD